MKRVVFFTLIFTAFSFILFSCADMFQGKIPMDTASELGSLQDLMEQKTEITDLETPTQIFVSQGDSPTTITVSWNHVEGAQSYRLERAVSTTKNANGAFEEPSEGDYTVITSSVGSTAYIYDDGNHNGTYYEDVILSDPKYTSAEYGYKYFYRVSAENIAKGYGSSDFITSAGGTLFAPPSSVSASAGTYKDRIVVKWDKSPSDSTQSYSIYRSVNSDGSNATKLATVKANMSSYTTAVTEADRGTEFYFSVRAQNKDGVESVSSALGLGYARADGAPVLVEDVEVYEGRGASSTEIKIKWTGDPETNYAVYRNSSVDSALTLLSSGVSGQTNYTFTDSQDLEENVYYYYMVQPWKLDSDGTTKVKGAMSDSGSKSSRPAEGFILGAPETVTVTKDSSGHNISWTPALGNDTERSSYSYEISGSDSKDGPFDAIATVPVSSLVEISGKYSYQNTVTRAYYKIRTKNSSGALSEYSAVQAPAPYAPKSIEVSCYKNLSGEMGSSWTANSNGVYPVKITWEAPLDSSDVAGYYVYRSDKRDSGYKRLSLNNDEKTFVITGNTFYDSNVSARTKKIYYYKVLSLNSLLGGANYSDVKWGYGALTASQYMKEYNIATVMNSQKKLTLMHKSGNTDKLGEETAYGNISGNLYYHAYIENMGGRVIMEYTDYADWYVNSNGALSTTAPDASEDVIGTAGGIFFLLNGNTNTSASMDTNGQMDGTVDCRGMYPGSVVYDSVKIKGGAAGGGYYVIKREGFDSENVSWTVGEEKK
jgi:hypothetical protein